MKVTKEEPVIVRNEGQDIGTLNVPEIKNFQISYRHKYVTAYDLSEIWGIVLAQATRTIKKTNQKFLRSAVLMLARRYRTDIVFTRNSLQGQ